MVKFYCDHCGNEVENLDALLEFSIDVTERPNRSIWNWRAEVCQECYEALKEEIGSRVVSPPAAEENKKKGVRKVTP
ncbi:MAG: hypothetical protein HYZ72_18380 [Deltaproteobacteria bacterium]|nr:hypothetical protein [Deltaproteobacteria bacterium]